MIMVLLNSVHTVGGAVYVFHALCFTTSLCTEQYVAQCNLF